MSAIHCRGAFSSDLVAPDLSRFSVDSRIDAAQSLSTACARRSPASLYIFRCFLERFLSDAEPPFLFGNDGECFLCRRMSDVTLKLRAVSELLTSFG